MPLHSHHGRVVPETRAQDELKQQIMSAISQWIKREGLTHKDAAKRLRIQAEQICALNGGRCGYSLGRLLDAWVRCGGTWRLDLKHDKVGL